jgi:hypothetical protein
MTPIDMVPVTDANGSTVYASSEEAIPMQIERLVACVMQDPASYLEAFGWLVGGLAGLWFLCSSIPVPQPSKATQPKKPSGGRR